MAKALILSGQGRYADQWHDYAGTTWKIAGVLEEIGLDVEVRGLTREALPRLDQVDLFVANTGSRPADPEFDVRDIETWDETSACFDAYIEAGRPVLALHTATSSLAANQHWRPLIGGLWGDKAWHPPIATCDLILDHDAHPIAAGLDGVTVYDERYTDLDIDPGSTPYLFHEEAGQRYPLAWARTIGNSRVIFDALGHGLESYESPTRRRLLQREAQWCLGLEITA